MKSVLLTKAEKMSDLCLHSYYYDYKKKMNMVRCIDSEPVPFIESKLDKLCVTTKTEAMPEEDDNPNELLMLNTKTLSTNESDDYGSVID